MKLLNIPLMIVYKGWAEIDGILLIMHSVIITDTNTIRDDKMGDLIANAKSDLLKAKFLID